MRKKKCRYYQLLMMEKKKQESAPCRQSKHIAHAHSQAINLLIAGLPPCKLTVENALAYYEAAKERLTEKEFTELKNIMKECKGEIKVNPVCTISKLTALFKDHPELLRGFGMFLPPTMNVLLLMSMPRFSHSTKEETDSSEMSENEGQDESLMETDTMNSLGSSMEIPDSSESPDTKSASTRKQIEYVYANAFLSKVKGKFADKPEVYQKFFNLLISVQKHTSGSKRDVQTEVYHEVCELFESHEDLIEEFKAFVPYAFYGSQNQESDAHNISGCLSDENTMSAGEAEDMMFYSIVNDPSIASVYKYGAFEEHRFFDNVRAVLGHPVVYDNFLRCLMLFNEDVITRSELVNLATSFLGKFPDLLKQFKDLLGFNESGNNIELIPMRIISLENKRKDPEIDLDIDYATGGRNGASYRALPKHQEQPKCSGRTQLCKEVLNDIWVSFPSWSEDSTFVTSCKTQFEEIIYRCEDERFELDMAIRANRHTMEMLEGVQKRINKMTQEEKSVFTLDDTLGGTSTVLHQKALHRLYGDKTDDLVEGLKRNPVVAVPIILKRAKGKEDEWRSKEEELNQIWRSQIDKYYLRSLDHQGINFKHNDSKTFRHKTLLNEMEMVYAERKEGKGLDSQLPHFLLEFKEMCVFSDAFNLMCQYLKKIPGVYRDDRRKIDHVIRSFIPDFFGLPREAIEESGLVEEEEDSKDPPETMEIENDEERSGQTSPSGSVQEDGSDQEEANSADENEAPEAEKTSFIEESDVFDKMDPLSVTTMPYTVFFANKSWYTFFRQFHILCERLSRLLFESRRTDTPRCMKKEDDDDEDVEYINQPSYPVLISKLSQLLSGAIDYSQFEEEARYLFGIHAFVSFTMDKLVLNVVRQLQQIVTDDVCKQSTAFFYEHTKLVSNRGFVSHMEASHTEHQYLKKVERTMEDERGFKIMWHKKDHTLTIQLMDHEEFESIPDPFEVECWSNYLETYITESTVCEDLLAQATGSPVFLPRNLKKQLKYWKRKVVQVEDIWARRHSPTFLQNNSILSLKKKMLHQSTLTAQKISRKDSREERASSSCSGPTYHIKVETMLAHDNLNMSAGPSSLDIDIDMENSDQINVKEDAVVPDDKTEKDKLDVVVEEQLDESQETMVVEQPSVDDEQPNAVEKQPIVVKEQKSDKSEAVLEHTDVSDEVAIEQVVIQEQVIKDEKRPDKDFPEPSGNIDPDAEDTHKKDYLLEPSMVDSPKIDVESMDVDSNSSESNFSTAAQKDSSQGSFSGSEESVPDAKKPESESSANVFGDAGEEIDLSPHIDLAIETANQVIETITVIAADDATDAPISNSGSKQEADKDFNMDQLETPTSHRCDYSIRTRRNKANQTYVKRRFKRNTIKNLRLYRQRRKKQLQMQHEEFFEDVVKFDYDYFSELSEEDKCYYLAMHSIMVKDVTECAFKRGSYKIRFVQNCDTSIHRKGCLTKAKENLQGISEMKTSNFNAWHRVWLDRYVTPAMFKFCNDWLLRGEPEKYRVFCFPVTDCSKPPYIPYNKYRIRYYKTNT